MAQGWEQKTFEAQFSALTPANDQIVIQWDTNNETNNAFADDPYTNVTPSGLSTNYFERRIRNSVSWNGLNPSTDCNQNLPYFHRWDGAQKLDGWVRLGGQGDGFNISPDPYNSDDLGNTWYVAGEDGDDTLTLTRDEDYYRDYYFFPGHIVFHGGYGSDTLYLNKHIFGSGDADSGISYDAFESVEKFVSTDECVFDKDYYYYVAKTADITFYLFSVEFLTLAGVPNDFIGDVDNLYDDVLDKVSLADFWTNLNGPEISDLSPARGGTTGGYELTISGANFGDNVGAVSVGGSECSILSWANSAISCTVPAGSGAVAEVVVSLDSGMSAASQDFGYLAPTLASQSISEGPTTGGNSLTLEGDNFFPSDVTSVTIGGKNCGITTVSHTRIVCSVPEGIGQGLTMQIDVAGQVVAGMYSYESPEIYSVSEVGGPTTGGTLISLTGINFGADSDAVSRSVLVGATPCNIASWSHSTVTCTTPAGQGSELAVSLSRQGESATAQQTFSYDFPSISAISDTSGSANGGNTVVITGNNFGLSAQVNFEGNSCAISSQSHTQISCVVPAGSAGTSVQVQIVVGGQSSNTLTYQYISSFTVSPSAGDGGSINPSSPFQVDAGSVSTLLASPDQDFELDSFSGTCGGSRSGSSFTTNPITQDCSVVANFKMSSGTVVPSAPTISLGDVSATSVQINFSSNGEGSDPITYFGANCGVPLAEPPQHWTQTTDGSSLTLSGLPAGTELSCFGWATNIAGDSAPSTTVTFTTPELPTAPSRPNILETDFSDGEIYLYVSLSSDGGSPITGYTASCTDGTNTYTGTSTSSPITVSGLTNEVAYTCTVTATNSVGTSSPSAATDPITPEATATGLPIWLLYQATQ